MNRQKRILSIVTVALIAGTALLLAKVPQKLGPPGVKATPVPGDTRWHIDLPENVLGLASTNHPLDGKALEIFIDCLRWLTFVSLLLITSQASVNRIYICPSARKVSAPNAPAAPED